MNQNFNKNVVAGGFKGELENVVCPICSTHESGSKIIFRKKNGVGIWKCLKCNILYASPRFKEKNLLDIYETELFMDFSYFDNWDYMKWMSQKDRHYIVSHLKNLLLQKYIDKGSKILDVGCATGFFCYVCMQSGFDVIGIDISKKLTDIGNNVLHLDLKCVSIFDFKSNIKFNGVVIWDVLEHVVDPIGILKRCHVLMKDDSYLFLQVPHYRGISHQIKTFLCKIGLKKTDFRHFGFPHHIFSFDKKSISILLKKAGFELVHIESWCHQYKDGKNDFLSKIIIWFFKKTYFSDYIVCVAKKIT